MCPVITSSLRVQLYEYIKVCRGTLPLLAARLLIILYYSTEKSINLPGLTSASFSFLGADYERRDLQVL